MLEQLAETVNIIPTLSSKMNEVESPLMDEVPMPILTGKSYLFYTNMNSSFIIGKGIQSLTLQVPLKVLFEYRLQY